ncbi:glycosyltransferase family 4 protein [Pedobacter sp.]|jgi:glycosyltransferase involved in cell wall biosynthesis|uniref:glycosyltransferase family 4 protein n=1 Tax=Pedobacter sp. TaxID=1411316 RepID=UPI002C58DBC3|nr:glycosyltransferase family 4 protein [Pedobacter sp.]HWW42407.1 glycosyltransferase family 4 protein [Pedobacter sp.]
MKIKKQIALFTCCIDDWGGSEELWAKSIPLLKDVLVTVYKSRINQQHPEFIKLKTSGVILTELQPEISFIKKSFRKINQLILKIATNRHLDDHAINMFYRAIKSTQPDLVVIAQGINFDGLKYAYQCIQLNIPYVIIVQKAVEFYWPYPTDRTYMKETLLKAERIFFVSAQNQRLTEEQFGQRLPNSKVVFNPVKTTVNPIPFPSTENGYHFACVARLFIIDKGQDLLLRIMAKDKWKQRPITISLIGSGLDEQGLMEMAELLHVSNVKFTGYQNDINALWGKHHALLLPSRSEGLPLSMIEAMAAGRTVIVSNAGGNAEIIRDGWNGFISESTETSFELAMDRAWEMRDQWNDIGKQASLYIAENFPVSPETDFANDLTQLFNER